MEQENKNNNDALNDLTRDQRLELEEQALQILLDLGCKFSVPLGIVPRKPTKAFLWRNRLFPGHAKAWVDPQIPKGWNVELVEVPDPETGKMKEVYMRNFHVKPLFLGTIDTIRKLYLNIEFDEEALRDAPIQETKKLFKYIPVMAEIAAVAIINQPEVANPLSAEVKDLKRFLINNMTVPRLVKLTGIISKMMNPGGFTNSIRSILEIGTTKPKADLIEKAS